MSDKKENPIIDIFTTLDEIWSSGHIKYNSYTELVGRLNAAKNQFETLQTENKQLVGALKKVRSQLGMIEHNWDYRSVTFMPSVIEALKKAEQ